jgi:hypothetical protein
MKIQLVLNLEIDTTETAGAIEDRLGIFDYDSLSGSFDDVLDEVAEITSVELENVEAL